MKIKEIVQLLTTTPGYAPTRVHIPDDVIELIRDHLPAYYDLFKEKEELYQEMLAESGEAKEQFIMFLKELPNLTEETV